MVSTLARVDRAIPRGRVVTVPFPVLSKLVLGGSCKAEVSRPRGRGCLRPTRTLLLGSDRRASGGAEAAPPQGLAGRYATPASLPSLGRGCRGRNRRCVPWGGTWTRRTVEVLWLPRAIPLVSEPSASLVAAIRARLMPSRVSLVLLSAVALPIAHSGLSLGTPLRTAVLSNALLPNVSASRRTAAQEHRASVRIGNLAVSRVTFPSPAACGRPSVKASELRMACERKLSAPFPPARERELPVTSIFNIAQGGGDIPHEDRTRSTTGTNFQGGAEIFTKRGEHGIVGNKDELTDRRRTLGSVFVVVRVTSILHRVAGVTNKMTVGSSIMAVAMSEFGMGIVIEWMDGKCRRKGSTARRRGRAMTLRGERNIHINMSITTIILTIAIDTENFVDTPRSLLNLREPFVDITEHIIIVIGGARAPGAAVTPRRYRPLALPTKERGVWLTSKAWLRRATVSWYRNFVITLCTLLILRMWLRLPLATARARAMAKGWLGMAVAAAAVARDLAPARSSCGNWEDAGARQTAARIGVYGNEPTLLRGTPSRNSAVYLTDDFLWGETVGNTLSYTPIHLAVGISIPSFLALVVLLNAQGGTAGTARGTRGTIIISIMKARSKVKVSAPSLRPHGVGPSSSSNCAGRAHGHQPCYRLGARRREGRDITQGNADRKCDVIMLILTMNEMELTLDGTMATTIITNGGGAKRENSTEATMSGYCVRRAPATALDGGGGAMVKAGSVDTEPLGALITIAFLAITTSPATSRIRITSAAGQGRVLLKMAVMSMRMTTGAIQHLAWPRATYRRR